MTDRAFDEFDHETHMDEAISLAHEAAARGDEPFGSVLVRDDEVIMAESNRVNTENDRRRHPELHLAYRACRDLTPEERAATVMYTSTEPCPMCAGGMRTAGFARVVYSVGADELDDLVGDSPPVRSAAILDDITTVIGPICNEAGREVHEAYGW